MKSWVRGTKLTREVEFRRDQLECATGESNCGGGRFCCVGRSASVDRYGGTCGQSRRRGVGCWSATRGTCRAYSAARRRAVGSILSERPVDTGGRRVIAHGGAERLCGVDGDNSAGWRNRVHYDRWNGNGCRIGLRRIRNRG